MSNLSRTALITGALVASGALFVGLFVGVPARSPIRAVDNPSSSVIAPVTDVSRVTSPARAAGSCLRAIPIETGPSSGGGSKYVAQFTGTPSVPLPLCPTRDFDVQVHSRDFETWTSLEAMQAQHGAQCAGPPAVHQMSGDYAAAVFQCKDHVMTSINATGYGVIYLTPDRLVDFSNGGTVSFDVSTDRLSVRDWIDVWITPYQDNIALPFDDGEVDLQGIPRRGVHVSNGNAEGNWIGSVIRDFESVPLFNSWEGTPFNKDILPGTNQDAVRQTFTISLSRTHVTMKRLASDTGKEVTFIDADVPDLGFTEGVVQFGHHSYNPTKDGAGKPGTWHWDNFAVEPAKQFTIINANRRTVQSSDDRIDFPVAAPRDSFLRFSAVGVIDYSVDGTTWKRATKAAASKNTDGYHAEHFSSYWTAIPAGTTSVRLRFSQDDWNTGPFMAKDFGIWSRVVE